MHILICNERFLFRFGADRVLILLGQHLKECGHTVTMMANRYDHTVAETAFSRIIPVPTDADDYVHLNEYTVSWLERTWQQHFSDTAQPDLVLVGGWPFFSSIPFFQQTGAKVVFIECGAVPLQGYTGGALVIQKKLRDLRKLYLPASSAIITNSQFIATSQSIIDSDRKVPIFPVLLGADHMQLSLWSSLRLDLERPHNSALAQVRALQQQGRKTILSLGRWEPGFYKNSEAAFDLLRNLIPAVPNCAMFILDDPSTVSPPAALREYIFPIGFPDDHELVEIMRTVDLGISVSLWEGFNLPLAEMQWLDRPVLAFDVAAHPEVILHPWYLCTDLADMTHKAEQIVRGQGLDAQTRQQALEKFRDYFKWSRVFADSTAVFAKLVQSAEHDPSGGRRTHERVISVIIDVTNSTRDPANSGVIRVTRRLCQELQRQASTLFVVWDADLNTYVLPTRAEHHQLSQFNGPVMPEEGRLSPDDHRIALTQILDSGQLDAAWLLLTETVREEHARHIRRFARSRGIRIGAIFHDAIPLLRPEFCNAEIKANHASYMRGLAECDVIIPNSHFSARCLRDFWQAEKMPGCSVVANELPGEFGAFPRSQCLPPAPARSINMLCVSTLEPRKNHATLLQACLRLQDRQPELDWSLTLVGNRYAGAFDIAESIEALAATNPRIRWLGIVDDTTLHQLYAEASFTVYPSIIEGFGMPILESLWHGRPCICSEDGVLGELAAAGGCLTTNVTDAQALSESLYQLATDTDLYQKLSQQALSRHIKTWQAYTHELVTTLQSQTGMQPPLETALKAGNTSPPGSPTCPSWPTSPSWPTWQTILYPNCLCDNWQMHDSERLALTALLARHQPHCTIEVGTYQGGSLSLLSQYSDMVFSIDIDPSIPKKFERFTNTSFLTGPSVAILPLLLKELTEAEISIDFLLIDSDHSAEGAKQDIRCLLSYEPKQPLFVMLYDSFNPECRRGMLEADWASCPYVEWIDIDFVPGRMVEYPGPFQGELGGGLALAYFSPRPRKHALQLQRSAEAMFQAMCAYTYPNRGKHE